MSTQNHQGRVTIVVPVYNRQEMLQECLESIEKQVYKNIEVLVVDDGSTDKSVAVAESFANRDPRFRVISHSTNSGSMNRAMHDSILACDSEFFTWIASDDKYLPVSAISQFVSQHNQQPKVDFVSCDLKMVQNGDSPNEVCPSCSKPKAQVWPVWNGFASMNYTTQKFEAYTAKSFVAAVYRSLCPPFPANGMWRTDFFRRNQLTWIEYEGNTQSADTVNLLQFFSKGMTTRHYNEFPLIQYRLHEGQDTARHAVKRQIAGDVSLIQAIFEWFPTEMFLSSEERKVSKEEAYLRRLDELAAHRSSFHAPSAELSESISDIAAEALLYLWEHRGSIPEESSQAFRERFTKLL